MFNLHDFILKGFKDAVGKMADYQVILNAVGWQEKGVLEDADLEELNAMIIEKNTIVEVPIEEIPIEETLIEEEPITED